MFRATLMTLMLASLAFAATAPTAQATCLDTNPDDDGVGSDGCRAPVLGECNLHALAYGQVPGVGGSCDGLYQCVRECTPPEQRTEALPCGGDLNPTDDNGITYRCRAASTDCTVQALSNVNPTPRFWCYRIACVTEPCATPVAAEMMVLPCNAPSVDPKGATGDGPVASVYCDTGRNTRLQCELTAAVDTDGVYRLLACEPIIQCVMDPCPTGPRLE